MKIYKEESASYVIALLLFCFCQLTFADTNCKQDKQCYCANLGVFYAGVAEARDIGESPQQYYEALGGYWGKLFSKKLVKKVINQVYFDPGFVNAGGQALNYQMRDICLGNTFKPLK